MKKAITPLVMIETRACHVTSGTPHLSGTSSISPPRPAAAEQASNTHNEMSRNASLKGGELHERVMPEPQPQAVPVRPVSRVNQPNTTPDQTTGDRDETCQSQQKRH